MKKSKIGLLLASFGCLALTVGSAVALTYKGASKSYTGYLDEAIYLYWGSGNDSVTIANVEDLVSGTNQYRFFACEPGASSGVSGTVTLTYKVEGQTKDEETYSLDGLTVNIYETTALLESFDSEKATLKSSIEFDTEDATKNSTTTSFAVTEGNGHAYYALEFIYDGTKTSADKWGGLMTISQDFAA